jgi:hypothetical protein
MWTRLKRWWHELRVRWRMGREVRKLPFTMDGQRYRLAACADRTTAQAAAQAPRVVAVVRSAGRDKWAYLMCPCQCGEQLAVNLMTSHYPAWRLAVRNDQDFTLYPSPLAGILRRPLLALAGSDHLVPLGQVIPRYGSSSPRPHRVRSAHTHPSSGATRLVCSRD